MTRFWAIFRNTFVQSVRQPLFGILILVTFAIMVVNMPLAGWTMGSDYHKTDQMMMENLGLATLLTTGMLLAAFTASSVLSREIEDKTALTVAAKPVTRGTFVLGKFAGVSAAVGVAYYLCTLAFLMLVRHKVTPAASDPIDWPVIVIGLVALGLAVVVAGVGNFVFGWHFMAALVWSQAVLLTLATGLIGFIGKGWTIVPFGEGIRPELLVGILLMFLAVVTFCSVAVAASTRVGQAMTLLICFVAFLVGSMHPFLFGKWGKEIFAVRLLGWLAPNLTYADALDALVHEVVVPAQVVWMTLAYFVLYNLGVLSLGISLYHGRELEARPTSTNLPGLVGMLAWVGRALAVTFLIAALAIVSVRKLHTTTGFIAAGVLLVAAAGLWVLSTAFGRGKKWAWWVVLVANVGGLAQYASAFQFGWPNPRTLGPPPLRVVSAVLIAAVLLILLLPKTRHYFASVPAKSK